APSVPGQPQAGAPVPRETVPVEILRSAPHGLVHTINVVRHDNGLVHLIFRWDAEGAAALPLDSQALARVLDIFRLRYRTADLPMDPSWAAETGSTEPHLGLPPNTALH
ncbi:hypothetical protein, partial [Staphylococcus haemolyticus]|uniref:hypothetical protein n=1 Tax=Staphylococcus haemolyticus TaxID=1283 RepID=UPI001E3FA61D